MLAIGFAAALAAAGAGFLEAREALRAHRAVAASRKLNETLRARQTALRRQQLALTARVGRLETEVAASPLAPPEPDLEAAPMPGQAEVAPGQTLPEPRALVVAGIGPLG